MSEPRQLSETERAAFDADFGDATEAFTASKTADFDKIFYALALDRGAERERERVLSELDRLVLEIRDENCSADSELAELRRRISEVKT